MTNLPTYIKKPEDASPQYIALMEALGFRLVIRQHISEPYWWNDSLGMSVRFATPFAEFAMRLEKAITNKTVMANQKTLREALFPALGLTTDTLYDEHDRVVGERVVTLDNNQ